MVLAARSPAEPGFEESLSRLCEAYWYPLYVFLRRRGHGADEALDLTQGFFLGLLAGNWLRNVRPEAGRFRSFLLGTLKHYLDHERRRTMALKRGGGRPLLSLDGGTAEERYRLEPADRRTPEEAYERRWALETLASARRRLAAEMNEAGKGETYRLLAPHLAGHEPAHPYDTLAARLGISEGAVKMAVLRLRRRYGRLLREEIAQTVDDEAAVDDELRHLLAIMGRG